MNSRSQSYKIDFVLKTTKLVLNLSLKIIFLIKKGNGGKGTSKNLRPIFMTICL